MAKNLNFLIDDANSTLRFHHEYMSEYNKLSKDGNMEKANQMLRKAQLLYTLYERKQVEVDRELAKKNKK